MLGKWEMTQRGHYFRVFFQLTLRNLTPKGAQGHLDLLKKRTFDLLNFDLLTPTLQKVFLQLSLTSTRIRYFNFKNIFILTSHNSELFKTSHIFTRNCLLTFNIFYVSDRLPPSPNPDSNRRWHKASFLRNAMQSGDSLSLSGFDVGNANPGRFISETELVTFD